MTTDVERLAILIEANTKSYERSMARIEGRTNKATGRAGRSISRLDKRIKTASASAIKLSGTFLAAFGGAVVVGGIAGLGSAIRDVTGEMASLAETADKVGLSIEDLQVLRLAGEEMGIAFRQSDVAMQRFSRRIAEASTGSGDLAKILKLNNIELRDQEGNLRPQIDILKEYANLIKNAGSEQEQLLLAFKAFDTEGAAFVNVLKQGANGLDEVFVRQKKLGNLFDEETVRSLKDVDQAFTDFSNTLAFKTKSAIVDAISFVSELNSEYESLENTLARIGNSDFFKSLASKVITDPDLEILDPDLARLRGETLGPTARIRDAFGTEFGEQNALEEALKRRASQGASASTDDRTTLLPTTGGKTEADRQAERIRGVVEALKFEADQLGRTAQQQELYNRLKQANVTLESDAGAQIEKLVENLQAAETRTKALEDAQKSAAQAADFLGNAVVDGFASIILDGEKASDVVKRLSLALADAALQGALLGKGPFAGVFGTKESGGAIGSSLSALFKTLPGFASGGSVRVGGTGGPDSQLFSARVSPGERIDFTPPGSAARGGGTTDITIRFVGSDGQEVEAQETPNSGGLDFKVMMDSIVGENIARSGSRTRTALQQSFGLATPLAGR